MSGRDERFRRTVSFDDDVLGGILTYRGQILIETQKDKSFGPAVNELLREILTQKNIISKMIAKENKGTRAKI